jgi:hypothetical protein
MKEAGKPDDDQGFDGDKAGSASKKPNWIAGKLAEIDVHADRKEEQAKQKSLERIDGSFDRFAEFCLGKQQTGNESAKCHGYAGHGGSHPGCDNHE